MIKKDRPGGKVTPTYTPIHPVDFANFLLNNTLIQSSSSNSGKVWLYDGPFVWLYNGHFFDTASLWNLWQETVNSEAVKQAKKFKEVTGWDTMAEKEAYDKGRSHEEAVMIREITNWDGSTNSDFGGVMMSTFTRLKNVAEDQETTLVQMAIRLLKEALIKNAKLKRKVDVSGSMLEYAFGLATPKLDEINSFVRTVDYRFEEELDEDYI